MRAQVVQYGQTSRFSNSGWAFLHIFVPEKNLIIRDGESGKLHVERAKGTLGFIVLNEFDLDDTIIECAELTLEAREKMEGHERVLTGYRFNVLNTIGAALRLATIKDAKETIKQYRIPTSLIVSV